MNIESPHNYYYDVVKSRLTSILDAVENLIDHRDMLSTILCPSFPIHLNHDSVDDDYYHALFLVASEWGGRVEVSCTEAKVSRKIETTIFWRLFFGLDPDKEFVMQIGHRTIAGRSKDRTWATNWYSSTDKHKYGYFNGGLIALAKQIDIPFLDIN